MNTDSTTGATVLDRLLDSLKSAANYSCAYQVRPVAVLWTDHEEQWAGLVDRLRAFLPQFLLLGDYAPNERCGPAIWIKCSDGGIPVGSQPGKRRNRYKETA